MTESTLASLQVESLEYHKEGGGKPKEKAP